MPQDRNYGTDRLGGASMALGSGWRGFERYRLVTTSTFLATDIEGDHNLQMAQLRPIGIALRRRFSAPSSRGGRKLSAKRIERNYSREKTHTFARKPQPTSFGEQFSLELTEKLSLRKLTGLRMKNGTFPTVQEQSSELLLSRKQFTAACVLILQNRGLLHVQEPISKLR